MPSLVRYVVLNALIVVWAGCSPELARANECLQTRDMPFSVGDATGFGALGNFPLLPLKKGEYVLTFDDGPSTDSTGAILQTLKKYCVHASFLMLGRNAERYPDLVKRVQRDGHTVGTHTYSHKNLTKLPFAEAKLEIDRGIAAVQRAESPSKMPRFFRFPNNVSTLDTRAYINKKGIIILSYDITAMDWKGRSPNITLEILKGELLKHDRGIIILHDFQENTAILLPDLLEYMKEKKYTIVSLSQDGKLAK